jgi:hypothetical protein
LRLKDDFPIAALEFPSLVTETLGFENAEEGDGLEGGQQSQTLSRPELRHRSHNLPEKLAAGAKDRTYVQFDE